MKELYNKEYTISNAVIGSVDSDTEMEHMGNKSKPAKDEIN